MAIGLALTLARPQSSPQTLYLHGTGTPTAPTLSLTAAAPDSGAPKYKDSPTLLFQNGNPWKDIGSWTSASSFATDLIDVDLWLALKTAERSPSYDLRAQIIEDNENKTVLASGESLCLTSLSVDPAAATHVTVHLTPGQTTGSGATRLALRLSARVGTTPAGARCVPPTTGTGAPGLRVYFDSADRASSMTTTPVSPPPPPPVNHPPAFTSAPATTAKHQSPYSYQATANDPDGDALTFALASGPQGMTVGSSGLVRWTPTGNQIGPQSVSLRVTDAKNASATQSFDIVVADATSPAITLTMASEALPGTSVTAKAIVNDNVGVASVTFEVNGADPIVDNVSPFERTVAVPGTATAGTAYHVHAVARDAAGNTAAADGIFTVAALPDTTPPTVALNVPSEAAPGTVVHLTAAAADANGVTSVTFKRGDTVLFVDTEAPFETTYTVPVDAAVGSSIAFQARALDFGNNFADASGSVVVVAAPDTTPPTVQLTAPPQIQEGGTLALSATAGDNVGVASVHFFVNGVDVGTATAAPYAATFKLPSSVKPGDVLHSEARASDFAGLGATSAQDTQVLAAPNRPPTASAGGPYAAPAGNQIQFSAAASSDPDTGDALTYDWNFGDGATGAGVAPRHGYSAAGSYVATVTVNDGREGTNSAQATVTIVTATDHTPPHVTVHAPSTVVPGSQVTVTAQATDDVGIASVTFDINGSNPTDTATAPYQRIVQVPAVASPGDQLVVHATARDAAGNQDTAEATLTISAVPDTQKPTVTLNAPSQAAAGTTLHLSAIATDNVGVQFVVFTVKGQEIAKVAAPPFEATYPIAANELPASTLGVSAKAVDFTGNESSANGLVTIAEPSASDTTPPTVTLSAPPQVRAGKTLTLSATAADNVGVAGVAFFVDGVHVSTSSAAPYGVTITVDPAALAGAILHLEARAVDFSGLQATATGQTVVFVGASAGQGIVTGEVYDDGTGLPIAGVDVTLGGQDVNGATYAESAVTDARGRWTIHATEGDGVIRFAKAGWTRADRHASIVPNEARELIDARLTRLTAAQPITPVLGGTVTATAAKLIVPPGALQAAVSLQLTAVSQQGLAGVLPTAWSPLAAVDIAPHNVSFAGGATLSLSNVPAVAAGRQIVIGRWDEQAAIWRAIGDLTVPSSAASLELSVPSSGQFALLVADLLPRPPPVPAIGEEIAGAELLPLSADLAAVINPQPNILFYKPDAHSEVRGTIAAPSASAPTSSGARIEARITESYNFLDGTTLHPEGFVEDIFFYQAGAPAASAAARFIVTPSQTFDPFALQSGVISVELVAPAESSGVPTVGPGGGTATAPTGESLAVPQGATGDPLPLSIQGLTAASLGIPMPADLTLAGSALLTFQGSLAKPATFSVPKPAAVIDASRLLFVRAQDLGGQTRFVLVGRATIAGDRIVSDTSLAGSPDVFEGVRVAGRYLFVQTTAPIGFETGAVVAIGGGAFQGALVSTNTLPIVALSNAAGRYAAASKTGAVIVTALDLQTADTGAQPGSVPSPGAVAQLNVQIAAVVPHVTSIVPVDGATNVPLSSPIVIHFSKPIVPASVNATTLSLAGPDGLAIAATIAFADQNTTATLRPSSPLVSNTAYTVSVLDTIVDVAGRHLQSAISAHFTGLNTAPPPAPPAGSIQASLPDATGFTTVTGTQGTAGVHDTVTILNLTTNASTPVLVDANGGFSVRVAARVTDKLQIVITSANGSQTVAAIGGFRQTNADGSISAAVAPAGGMIEGPAGTAVEVPEGAFPDGAIITITKIDEAQFPVQLDADAKALLGFSGGVQLDLGGKTPEKYLNVFVPAGPNDHVGDQWLVSRARDNNGLPVLDIVDTAKLIGGRIRTSSPPCPGVTSGGTFGVYKSAQPIGLSYAHMSSSGYGGMQMQATMMFASLLGVPWFVLEPPVPGPICYPVLTGKVTVTANSQLITIPAGQLTPADREIVVKNTTRTTEAHFPRNVLEFTFEVAGAPEDSFTVVVKDANNAETPVTSVTVTDAGSGKVVIHLDPDTIPVSVASVAIKDVTSDLTTVFGQAQIALKLAIAGGAADAYEVTAIDANDHSRSITPGPVLSPNGAGNMRARAIAGTFDAAGRTKVVLDNTTQSTTIEIPAATIVDGGFAFAFDGGLTDRYSVVAFYDNGQQIKVEVPTFRITVQNRTTGRVIKTIVAPAPPRDEPLNLGVISDDVDPPILTSGPVRLIDFDPNGFLTFTFNEAMDPASLKAGLVVELVRNGQHIRVAGDVRISNGNRTVTFVPNVALGVGEEYVITFVGNDALGRSLVPGAGVVTDRSGNSLGTTRFRMTTFKPRTVGNVLAGKDGSGDSILFKDVEVRRKTVNEQVKTYLATVTDSRIGHRLATYDVTDPVNPIELKKAQGGGGKKRLTLIPDIGTPQHPAMSLRAPTQLCDGTTSQVFKGDLAVATSWNTYNSYLSFYDVTDPSKACLLANKLLTAAPDTLSDFSRKGTVHALGFARGVATIQHAQGYAAYAAVGEVGLFAADIGKDIPEYGPDTRVQEQVYPGDYYDVVNVSDRLFAANRGDSRLEIFDPNLALLQSIDLPAPPRRITTVSGYGVDLNQDGLITPAEQFDLAFVAVDDPSTGVHAIEIVDITNDADLHVVGEIGMPGIIRDLVFDPDKRRLFAAGEGQSQPGSDAVFMIDLSNPFRAGAIDSDGDGTDDRIMWRHAYPSSVGGIRLDRNRGLLYVASDLSLDFWAVYDGCCDLSVDMTARAPRRQTGDREALFTKEKKALQQEITAGLQNAATTCGTPLSSLAILEQGSGACLWKGDPGQSCGNGYQPGLSDHDYEVFFPAAVPAAVQACTVGELSKRFLDPQTGDPKEITIDGSTITFEDVTFFPFRREDFESAKLNVDPPKSAGGDATGDLGLGRQQLLLLWVLSGEYVPLPQLPAVSPGRSLAEILQALKTVTGIAQLEGFEWANLQSFNLAKSKALLRLAGASDPASSLHPIFVKQLHDAAKAGIRAAFGRLVADVAGNAAATRVTRLGYEMNACLAVTETVTNPNKWLPKRCTSFEDYAASAIARTLQGPAPLPLFTLADVYKIHRFYRVKADVERITTEAAADAFIAGVSQFLEQSKLVTQPIYQQQIGTMPDVVQRTANLNAAQAKRLTALKSTRISLDPHVFNRGFRGAEQVAVAMYRTDTPGSGQLVKSIRVDLAGGDDRIFDFAHNPDGTLKVDEGNQAVPIFELGPIDLTTDIGTLHGVSFTIDLPEHKVAEAVRDNNVGGFFYYALDVQNPTAPPIPPTPNLPLDPSVLEPSPECESIPALAITQRLITSDGKILTGDVVELGLGETVMIELIVTNHSGDVQTGVMVCSALTNQCYSAGSLGVGESKTIKIPFVAPAIGRYLDATPSTMSTEGGIVTGAPMRIVASCEPYSIVPHEKDPNPETSEAMIGGRALRYYKVINQRTGAPRGNATVDFELNGFFGPGESTQHFTFKTDAQGRIFDPANPAPAGAVPGLPIAASSQMVAGSVYFGTIRSVDGIEFACRAPLAFEFMPADRDYTRSYSRGTAIEGSIGLLVSAELGAEAGMEIEKEEAYRAGAKTLNLTTSAQLSGKLGVEFTLGFEAEGGGRKLEAGAEFGVSSTRMTSWTMQHAFDYPLDQAKNCAIAELTLKGMVGVNPLLVKLLDLARTNPCGEPTAYLKSTSRSFGREAAASANLELKATSPLSDENPTDKRLNVTFGADGAGGFGIEVNHATGYDVPNHGSDPVSLSEEYTLKGSLNLHAGLEIKEADPPAPPKSEQDKEEEKTSVETEKRGLKTDVTEDLAENYTVTFTYDFSKPRPEGGYPSSVDVSYSPPKGFGWKRPIQSAEEKLANGKGRKLTYTIEDPADVKVIVDGLANLDAIRKANVGVGLVNQITLAPTLLNDELAKFRTLLRQINATYTITESTGEADEKPFGLSGKLGPFKLGGKLALKAEHKVAYTVEKGIVLKGASYVLESYARDQYVPTHDLGLWDALTTTWTSLVESFAAAHFSDVNGVISNQGTTRLRSNFTATMDIDGTKEPASFEAGLFSWRFRPIDGPVQDAHYMPADTAGARALPHYGVGSFHQFSPDGYQLAVPTPLVIDYTDDEVAGIDESSLRIYGWNADAGDWDLVGGVVDTAANTVTAPVSTFRLYTLGPAMPAHDIALTVHDDGTTGAGDAATQRFTVTSGPLVMNTGQPVPDGTLYTVRSLVPASSLLTSYGTILTADDDPARAEVQVAAHGGVIQFQVEYPAPNGLYIPGRLAVYSTTGTAFGQSVAVKP